METAVLVALPYHRHTITIYPGLIRSHFAAYTLLSLSILDDVVYFVYIYRRMRE